VDRCQQRGHTCLVDAEADLEAPALVVAQHWPGRIVGRPRRVRVSNRYLPIDVRTVTVACKASACRIARNACWPHDA